jgi:hypothetical protein
VLVIAATEAAKLLDLEALKVLPQSPRFAGVVDDTLRALLLSDGLWRSSEGSRIVHFLFEILNSNQHEEIVEAAFTAMTGLNRE